MHECALMYEPHDHTKKVMSNLGEKLLENQKDENCKNDKKQSSKPRKKLFGYLKVENYLGKNNFCWPAKYWPGAGHKLGVERGCENITSIFTGKMMHYKPQ
jgi:hypothetical protein